MNIDTMSDRQLVAGLMRGSRAEMRMGYSVDAAVSAVVERRELSSLDEAVLRAYAQGFADGMVEDGSQAMMPQRESDA